MPRPDRLVAQSSRFNIHNQQKKKFNTSLKLVLIFFIIAGLTVVARLFWLQIINHDYYLAKARDQQEFYAELAPTRGQIFVYDKTANGGKELYPLATNRRLFNLYAVPRDLEIDKINQKREEQTKAQERGTADYLLPVIIDPTDLAEILFETFDQPAIIAEIKQAEQNNLKKQLDEEMSKLPSASSSEEIATAREAILKRQQDLLADKFYQEMAQARYDAALKEKSEAKIADYLKILNKGNDPYEVITKKLEGEQILKLYFKILSRVWGDATLSPTDLSLDGETVIWQPKNEDKKYSIIVNGLGQTSREYRYYPEKNIEANILGFVSFANDDDLIGQGKYGLEEAFDDILAGRAGLVKGDVSANRAVILGGRDYRAQTNGSDLILTIDRSIQNFACTKLLEAVAKHQADGGSVVIIDPKTGAVLAMCSAPNFDPNNYSLVKDLRQFNNQSTFEAYEPGSIFKAITMAIGIDQGKVTPQTTYNDSGSVMVGHNKINNSDFKGRGVVNMVRVLQDSLNTGAVFVMRQIGLENFRAGVVKFGFGEKTGIELPAESAGSINNLYQKFGQEINAATASFGQGINVTTLQMAMAFGALANEGKLMRPYLVQEIVSPDGTRVMAEPQVVTQAISPEAARTVGGMLVNVVEDGHGKKAGVEGYYVAGKTGTAQVPSKNGRGYIAGVNIGSFAGYAPVDDPAFVMVVRIDHPRGVIWAESSAAPLFGEIANFILKYKQIPAERPIKN